MPVAAHQGNGDQLFAGRGKPGNSKMRTNQNHLGLSTARTKATLLRENAEKKRARKNPTEDAQRHNGNFKKADPDAEEEIWKLTKSKS